MFKSQLRIAHHPAMLVLLDGRGAWKTHGTLRTLQAPSWRNSLRRVLFCLPFSWTAELSGLHRLRRGNHKSDRTYLNIFGIGNWHNPIVAWLDEQMRCHREENSGRGSLWMPRTHYHKQTNPSTNSSGRTVHAPSVFPELLVTTRVPSVNKGGEAPKLWLLLSNL